MFNEMFWRVIIGSKHQEGCRKVVFTVQSQEQTVSPQLSTLKPTQEDVVGSEAEERLSVEKNIDDIAESRDDIAESHDDTAELQNEDSSMENNYIAISTDGDKLQRSRSESLLSDSGVVLETSMKVDDPNFLTMENRCVS